MRPGSAKCLRLRSVKAFHFAELVLQAVLEIATFGVRDVSLGVDLDRLCACELRMREADQNVLALSKSIFDLDEDLVLEFAHKPTLVTRDASRDLDYACIGERNSIGCEEPAEVARMFKHGTVTPFGDRYCLEFRGILRHFVLHHCQLLPFKHVL